MQHLRVLLYIFLCTLAAMAHNSLHDAKVEKKLLVYIKLISNIFCIAIGHIMMILLPMMMMHLDTTRI